MWQSTGSDRICSIHIVDGIPSTANPTPTLYLGYELEAKKSRRNLFKHPAPLKKQKLDQTTATNSSNFMTVASEQPPHSKDLSTDLDKENNLPLANVSFLSPVSDHLYCSIQSSKVCTVCVDKSNLIESLVSKVKTLTLTCQKLKRQKLFDSV